MKKKLLSFVLVLAMMLSLVPASIFAEDPIDINVYVTFSNGGQFVKDKDNNEIVERQITLTGKSAYTIDDAIYALHELYYAEGTAGYSTENGQYGLSITKLWGDESGKFGYQLSGGAISVTGLSQPVIDGDYLDLCIYQSYYPDTEDYSAFESYKYNVKEYEPLELCLKYLFMDPSTWESSMVPCSDAALIIDNELTEYITDNDGKVTIDSLSYGKHIISAKKEKEVEEETVTAITAPVCVVNVDLCDKAKLVFDIMTTIASLSCDKASADNAYEMIAYQSLDGAKYQLSNDALITVKNSLVNTANTTQTNNASNTGKLFKPEIALRALGVDSKQLYNVNSNQPFNLASKIKGFDVSQLSYNLLPYSLFANMQGNIAYSDEQIIIIIDKISQTIDGGKGSACKFGYDTAYEDAAAVSIYCKDNTTASAIRDFVLGYLKTKVTSDGAIGNANTCSMAIIAMAANGIDAFDNTSGYTTADGKTAIDLLLNEFDYEVNKFKYNGKANDMATEQGFRALISAYKMHLSKEPYLIYDCSDIQIAPYHATGTTSVFEVPQTQADDNINVKISIKGVNGYLLTQKQVVVPTDSKVYHAFVKACADNGVTYTMTSDYYISSIKGLGEFDYGPNSGWLYKVNGVLPEVGIASYDLNNNDSIVFYYTEDWTQDPSAILVVNSGSSTNKKATEPAITFTDVVKGSYYEEAVNWAIENKITNGVSETEFGPELKTSRGQLVTFLWRLAGSPKAKVASKFSDVVSGSYYADAVEWAVENGITDGIGNNLFDPEADVDRSQVVTFLWRYKNSPKSAGSKKFDDITDVNAWYYEAVGWASEQGITDGVGDNKFNPSGDAVRAQAVTFLYRLSKLK